MRDQATKYGGARKTKSCRHQDPQPVQNASLVIKASRTHHQGESLEAPNKGEIGSDNTPSKHHKLCIQMKQGYMPKFGRQCIGTRE